MAAETSSRTWMGSPQTPSSEASGPSSHAQQRYESRKPRTAAFYQLTSAAMVEGHPTSGYASEGSGETAALSTPIPRSGSSYFELYPERKSQGPYVPKPALLPAMQDCVRQQRRSKSPASPASADLVSFPTSSKGRASLTSSSTAPSSSGASTPSSSASPASRSLRASPLERDRVRGTAARTRRDPAERGLSLALADHDPPAASIGSLDSAQQRLRPISSVPAASSHILGKAGPKPLHIATETIPSIDDIIRSHAATLKPAGLRTNPPLRRLASDCGPPPRRGGSDARSLRCGDRQSGEIAASRQGAGLGSLSNTSESSLDSVELEIREGIDRLSSPVSSHHHRAVGGSSSPRRRSFSAGTRRAPNLDELENRFAQARAFQSLAQLNEPDGEAPTRTLPPNRRALQAPFVESGGRSKLQTKANGARRLSDAFEAADGGSLTNTMTVRGNMDRLFQISYADVGSRTGRPVFVFLGLGAVRYLVGLYDELAVALGLRLICIDRWGLGRTDDVPMERRSILGWSAVVTEVAERLTLERFSVLAHSAGAPYAMATALVFPERLIGPVHLLSPFTGANAENGYRWLRYVPDGVIRTAQVAEWKLQGWKLGKLQETPKQPGRSCDSSVAGTPASMLSVQTDWTAFSPARGELAPHSGSGLASSTSDKTVVSLSTSTPQSSPSQRSGSKDEQDGVARTPQSIHSPGEGAPSLSKKSSLSFLGGLLGARQTQSEASSPTSDTQSVDSSLRGLGQGHQGHRHSLSRSVSTSSSAPSWEFLDTISVQERREWPNRPPVDVEQLASPLLPSISSSKAVPALPVGKAPTTSDRRNRVFSQVGDSASVRSTPDRASVREPEAGLGVALLRASHSESARGSASDLSLVMGKRPWGFDFSDVKYPCRLWHGSRDERVSLASAKWMERALEDCRLTVVEGAGHNLMSNTAVIFEVLESIQSFAALA